MVNKRAYDPEASLRASDGSYDPLIRKQNSFLESKLEPKPTFQCGYAQLCLLFVVLVTGGIVLGLVVFAEEGSTSDSVCFVEPSCSATSSTDTYNNVSGFSNDTGWASGSSSACCEICLPGTPSKVCFDPDNLASNCMQKAGQGGDYDYLVLDQLWLPQLCNALQEGHDPTLSHLEGAVCNTATESTAAKNTAPILVMHGLWPNYVDGFPQCCDSMNNALVPLVPGEVVGWNMWPELQTYWFDPTTTVGTAGQAGGDSVPGSDGAQCNVCYLLNHEWMKHGTCFGADEVPGNDPQEYFYAGLELYHALGGETYDNMATAGGGWPNYDPPYSGTNTAAFTGANGNVSAMAGMDVNITEITSLYPTAVNVICDPNDPRGNDTVGILLEIQTCWLPVMSKSIAAGADSGSGDAASATRTGTGTGREKLRRKRRLGVGLTASSYDLTDCTPASPLAFTTPCPDTVHVPLYSATPGA